MKRMITLGCLSLGPLLLATPGSAAPLESLQRILAAAETFALSQVSADDVDTVVRVGRLDPRLRLPLCDQALAGYWSNGSRNLGHTTVGVRCDGSPTWSLFVPVQISQQRPVAVLSRPINQGAELTPDSVTLVKRDVAPFTTGYFSTLQNIEGMIARRPLTAGTVLTPSLLDAPKLVRRGDQVRIEAANALINVQAMGTALRDGRSGERIPVKNLHSERVIEARVIAQGIVKIADRSVR